MVNKEIIWRKKYDDDDYKAALDFLELHFSKKESKFLVDKLQKNKTTKKKAKDILRASGLPLLSEDNIHVKHNLSKHKEGKKFSPVLLVCVSKTNKLIIADGYHRICSVYYIGEDFNIPCKLVYKI